MATKKKPAARLRDKNGDPISAAAVMEDIRRYLLPPEAAQPKKTAISKKGQKKSDEIAHWDENGNPTNDAAVVADIMRYLTRQ